MKTNTIIKLAALLFTFNFSLLTAFAQSPEKMTYQAVIRNASDQLVTNQDMGMQISILQGSETGTDVYAETHNTTTNTNGLVSVEIGNGTVVSGDFSAIDWANDIYFLKTETDPTTAGGTNYTITGTSQLLSVPYALFANATNYMKLTPSNNFIGHQSGESNTTGLYNSFMGNQAGFSNSSGTQNLFLGQQTGENSLTGNYNTYLGALAGRSNISGEYNVFVGYGAGYNETGSQKLYIDNNYLSTSSTAFMYGDFITDELRINANLGIWSVPSATYELYVNGDLWASTYSKSSDKRWKINIYGLQNSLEVVKKLRGVSFNWKVDEYPEKRFKNGTHAGFIAQEVERILPDLVKADDKGFKSVEYTEVIPYLVESIKEQQQLIDKQQEQINMLINEIENLKK